MFILLCIYEAMKIKKLYFEVSSVSWLGQLTEFKSLMIVIVSFRFCFFAWSGLFILEFKSLMQEEVYTNFSPHSDLNSNINSPDQATNKILKTNNYNNQWFKLCQLPKPGDRRNVNTHKTCWKCCNNNERPTGRNTKLLDGMTVENR